MGDESSKPERLTGPLEVLMHITDLPMLVLQNPFKLKELGCGWRIFFAARSLLLNLDQSEIPTNMKLQLNQKTGDAATAVERKHTPARAGSKVFVHRYERRKIREQLRRLDWALPGED